MKKIILVLGILTTPVYASPSVPIVPNMLCSVMHTDWQGNTTSWTVEPSTGYYDTLQEEKGDWHFTRLDEEMPVESVYINKSTLKGVVYTREPNGELFGQGTITCREVN